jgi:hypothetical protein
LAGWEVQEATVIVIEKMDNLIIEAALLAADCKSMVDLNRKNNEPISFIPVPVAAPGW